MADLAEHDNGRIDAGRDRTDPAGQGRPTRVLLAEDDSLLAATIEDFLRADGFSVMSAPDGEAALTRALSDLSAFDVLLTDLRMPRLDGTALILALRVRRPGLPVVVMSGNVPHGWTALMARELAGQRPPRLLTKPMSFDQVRSALRDEVKAVQAGH